MAGYRSLKRINSQRSRLHLSRSPPLSPGSRGETKDMCTLPSHGFAADAGGALQPSHPFYAISQGFNRSVKSPLLPSWPPRV